MQVNSINRKNTRENLSFGAGRNMHVNLTCFRMCTSELARDFKKTYGIDADFKGNQAIATCCAYAANIFDHLRSKFNVIIGGMPPSIRVYNEPELYIKNVSGASGFCIEDSYKVLNHEPPFEMLSMFFNNRCKTITELEEEIERNHAIKHFSTNHFLHVTIHEWSHCVHMDNLYRIFGYDGTCAKGLAKYNPGNFDPNPYINGRNHMMTLNATKFTDKERDIIKGSLSTYAAGIQDGSKFLGGNPFELVAEDMTKRIINSLDKDSLMPSYNPFQGSNNPSHELYQLIENAWRGSV